MCVALLILDHLKYLYLLGKCVLINYWLFHFPQAFYTTGKGKSVISHKSDVWSGCVTMMNILVGKEVNEEPDKHVRCILYIAQRKYTLSY